MGEAGNFRLRMMNHQMRSACGRTASKTGRQIAISNVQQTYCNILQPIYVQRYYESKFEVGSDDIEFRSGLEILYILGAKLLAKKSPRAKKEEKKEEKREERETKEMREEENKYGMKKVKRDQGKRKRAPVTPNQTVGARKRKGKEEDKESIGAKKEKINGA